MLKSAFARTPKESRTRLPRLARAAWPVALLLGILWFPFDWLATVWPAFGVPFRQVFHNAHDHFVGHTVFFLLVGMCILALARPLRARPWWYALGLVVAMLAQETIQAFFRRQLPTFTDFNAFKGDALGGASAYALWQVVALIRWLRARRATGATG
ncbi:MAG TPA: hypothetical protein VGR57_08835 [Ktedonobacterales bacterium]|nr:hypothetical protein [Ktedonobacterales bacterium]